MPPGQGWQVDAAVAQSPLAGWKEATKELQSQPSGPLALKIPADLQRQLSRAAAHTHVSMNQYVVDSVKQRLGREAPASEDELALAALSAQTDPVLAELWDNEKDAVYEAL